MHDLKIKTHLMLFAAVLMLGLLGVGIAGLLSMSQMVQGLETVYLDRVVPLRDLKKISDLYAVNIVDAAQKAHLGTTSHNQALQQVEQGIEQIQQLWKAFQNTQLTVAEAQLIERVTPLMSNAQPVLEELLDHLKNRRQEQLANLVRHQLYPSIDPLVAGLSDLINVQLDEAKRHFDSSQALYTRQLRFCLLILMSSLLLGAIYSQWLSRRIDLQLGAEPHELSIISSGIARGDLTSAKEPAQRKTSGVLLSVQGIRDNLREIVSNINQASRQIESATVQLSQSCESGLANATLQSETASSIAATVEQLSVSITHIASNAQQASSTTYRASEIAANGMTQMKASVKEIDQIAALVTETSVHIDHLATLSKSISQIVGVIRSIAEQTNLLALNAAIEAARAGDQGRGFAVVAEEVRNLATRTSNSTEEIVALVEGIQNGADKAKNGMDQSRQRMNHGLQLVESAENSMDSIKNVLDESLEAVSLISTSLQEQQTASEHVAFSVEKVAQSVESIASSQHQTAQTTRQLKGMSEQLEVILQRFNL
ncbi:methyl-accepting chemotaxis protein [Pseudomonas sp. LD120]|nr:methyl-accepting chemotaxis protein [Pseudomonas sp. LD120]KAF0862434.1 methyl-accepting chemotaxis protein [Pseudomonas sp. LD120]